jgi:hypothetical protein
MLTRRGLLSSLLASGFARAAEPDIANLFPLLEANSLAQPRKLGFMDPRWKKLDAWKKEARPRADPPSPLQPDRAPALGQG